MRRRAGPESGALARAPASTPSLRAQRSNPESFRGCLPGLLRCARNDGVCGGQRRSSIRISLADTLPHPRGISRPSFACRPTLNRKRAQGRPGAGRAPTVHCAKGGNEEFAQRHTGEAKHPAFPAQWLYGLCRALPGERCTIAPVALRMADAWARLGRSHHRKTWRTDPGRQDHTILPYANRTRRWREVFAHGYPPCEAFRTDVARVHRPLARVRDDRDTPLFLGPGCAIHATFPNFGKVAYFRRFRLT